MVCSVVAMRGYYDHKAYLYTFEHATRLGHFSVALRDEFERFSRSWKRAIDGCE